MVDADAEIDTCGLNCPLPILKARKALASLQRGQILRVIATDPESIRDFSEFCDQLGHTLLETHQNEGKIYFLLRKKES
ncbi:MAG: SirA family protein [Candidatus Contendobacter odensis]|uniref:SirA family protein n=1 Tax=Candidatus Contendibacter odensensis TaxID=1400860 RepID=A0A2G6PEN4_9GAMM|nr:MAG: SirA family protein [Candidatus Contendobacter odensis]